MTSRERILYLRALYGLNQTDVGVACGFTRNYISQLENGHFNMSQEQEIRIVNAIYKIGEAKKQGRLQDVLNDLKKQNKKNIE
ncbi:helix-turn-helix domain-containing protein [Clostridium cibarium]|uniref:Helix-turn-helix transcriptional regulator n=1 Tax=Clostridium cibarium TaxID=2762247 RepID=A0ABR8PNI5_9CLOT|nr:helix-turn-helix transcriptional regulator [Clostridium cibarium]MBD7909738.1 helix-turn-helix transcriptional regulator [Clostridium cibarium]